MNFKHLQCINLWHATMRVWSLSVSTDSTRGFTLFFIFRYLFNVSTITMWELFATWKTNCHHQIIDSENKAAKRNWKRKDDDDDSVCDTPNWISIVKHLLHNYKCHISQLSVIAITKKNILKNVHFIWFLAFVARIFHYAVHVDVSFIHLENEHDAIEIVCVCVWMCEKENVPFKNWQRSKDEWSSSVFLDLKWVMWCIYSRVHVWDSRALTDHIFWISTFSSAIFSSLSCMFPLQSITLYEFFTCLFCFYLPYFF